VPSSCCAAINALLNSLEEITDGQDKAEFDHCSLFINVEYFDPSDDMNIIVRLK
jgi:hypothetical protein